MVLKANATGGLRSSKPQPAVPSALAAAAAGPGSCGAARGQCALFMLVLVLGMTTLTRRPGTTMTRLGARALARTGEVFAAPRASFSISALQAPAGTQQRAAQLAVDLQHEFDLVLLPAQPRRPAGQGASSRSP